MYLSYMNTDTYIISLGGSLIIPQSDQSLNTYYLQHFSQLILNHIAQGKRFFIIAGGGYTARHYQQAGKTLGTLTSAQLDWLGIYATHLNAQFVRMMFHECSYPYIITSEKDLIQADNTSYPVTLSAGWHPGNSTDYIAVKIAEHYQVKKIINLSNIDYVYSSDPRTNPDAQPFEKMTWSEFQLMVGDTWDPGASAPFDPIASMEASENDIDVAILNGENLENLDSFLNHNEFRGTVIHS